MKSVLALIAAVAVGLLGRESWGWLPRLSRGVIWLETLLLPRDRRAIRREEWAAELTANYDDRRISGLIWTLRLCPIVVWERTTGAFTSVRRNFPDAARFARTAHDVSTTVVIAVLASIATFVLTVAILVVGIALAHVIFGPSLGDGPWTAIAAAAAMCAVYLVWWSTRALTHGIAPRDERAD